MRGNFSGLLAQAQKMQKNVAQGRSRRSAEDARSHGRHAVASGHEAAVLRLDASSLNAKSLPGLQPVGTFSHFCRAFDAAATLRNTCAFVS